MDKKKPKKGTIASFFAKRAKCNEEKSESTANLEKLVQENIQLNQPSASTTGTSSCTAEHDNTLNLNIEITSGKFEII